MAAIGREFVVFSLFNVLFDAAAVLETESKIVCAHRIALLTALWTREFDAVSYQLSQFHHSVRMWTDSTLKNSKSSSAFSTIFTFHHLPL
jgi:hypothetical protein